MGPENLSTAFLYGGRSDIKHHVKFKKKSTGGMAVTLVVVYLRTL